MRNFDVSIIKVKIAIALLLAFFIYIICATSCAVKRQTVNEKKQEVENSFVTLVDSASNDSSATLVHKKEEEHSTEYEINYEREIYSAPDSAGNQYLLGKEKGKITNKKNDKVVESDSSVVNTSKNEVAKNDSGYNHTKENEKLKDKSKTTLPMSVSISLVSVCVIFIMLIMYIGYKKLVKR